jgi:RHS repeat-associated protein
MSTYLAGELTDHYEYKYDLLGNQTSKDENGEVTRYLYDALSRLKIVRMPENHYQVYEYDDYSNIESLAEMEGRKIAETLYYYDEAGRLVLTSCENDGTQSRFRYDAEGNLVYREDASTQYGVTASEECTYIYNGSNQLTTVMPSGGEICEYTYDLEGLRAEKISGGETIGYVYENGYIILETDGCGYVTAKNVWGAHLLARDTEDGTYSYRFNGHGDIIALTDEFGTILQDYAYDPYGNELADVPETAEGFNWQAQDVEYDNPFRYCGEYFDEETGFYYLRARYYDPDIRRFISEDPARDGLNWYVYCANNPIVFFDPWGLDAIIINSSDSAKGAGHMSALVQDENGNWFYYFWGGNVKYERIYDDSALANLNSLNKFLISSGYMEEGDYPYDSSVYIKGDFSESSKQFAQDADNWESTHGDYYEVISGLVNENPEYDVLNKNCTQMTLQGIFLGILPDGTTVEDYYNDIGFDIGTVPNTNSVILKALFYNSAYTLKEFNASIKSYEDKYKNGNWWYKWYNKKMMENINRIS